MAASTYKELAGGRPSPTAGGLQVKLFQVTGNTGYTGSGGDPVTAATFGLTTLFAISDGISGGKVIHWDPVNAKIQILVCGASGAALQEVAGASDQSAVTAPVVVIGA